MAKFEEAREKEEQLELNNGRETEGDTVPSENSEEGLKRRSLVDQTWSAHRKIHEAEGSRR